MIGAVLLEAEGLLSGDELLPGVVELLRRIHADGRLVGVVSLSGPGRVRVVRECQAGGLVHARAWGPTALERAALALSFRTQDTAVIAATPDLVRAAAALGARTLGLSRIADPGELRAAGAEEVHEGPAALLAVFPDSLLGGTVLALSDQNTG